MYKDNAVVSVVPETGRDFVFGTTARLSDLSTSLTGEVRRSPEPSARPSAAADSEERQICTAAAYSWRALDCAYAFSHRARFQRQHCWKRGGGDGQRLSLYDYCTTERSFNAVEKRGCLFAESVGL